MTLPDEELCSIKRTHEFLRDLLRMNITTIRKEARTIRERASRCLRHYPWDMVVEKLWEKRIKDMEDCFKEK